MSGKGSDRRPGDDEKYRSEHSRIFNPKVIETETVECSQCHNETLSKYAVLGFNKWILNGDEWICGMCELRYGG